MYDRKKIKQSAKASMKANYWPSVVAALIVGAFTKGAAASSASKTPQAVQNSELSHGAADPQFLVILAAILSVIAIAALLGGLINIFVGNVVKAGGAKFFTESGRNAEDKGRVRKVFDYFSGGHYGNAVKVMFFKNLYIDLWLLLFIVPGVIKSLQYAMVEYILADDPEISYRDALSKSKEMMQGNKMRLFWLDLSFIGWDFLSILTLGLLQPFYVNPWRQQTKAAFYEALKGEEPAAEIEG